MKMSIKSILKIWPSALFIIISFGLIIFSNSCANQGIGPQGGPKDTIPPVIVNSSPSLFEKNFKGNQIEITFNEYIVLDKLNEKIVFSPPLSKKPTIKIQGKSVIIKAEEDFQPNRTYSIDLKDGIKDFTEGNIYKDLRLVFSTSDYIDSMQIGGYVLDAFTLDPKENCIVSLYSSDSDTLFKSSVPDFIAKTDKEGFFLFNNIPSEKFKIFAVADNDNNLYYSQKIEPIAFLDSLIIPEISVSETYDTINNNADSVILTRQTEYYPMDICLLLFNEDVYDQYIASFKRVSRDKCVVAFNEKLSHPAQVKFISSNFEDRFEYVEYNKNKDSLNIWITDSLFASKDTVFLKIIYPVLDSLGESSPQTDTLRMVWSDDKKVVKPNAPEKDTKKFFCFTSNIIPSNFELNNDIIIEAPSPIDSLQKDMISFIELVNDSVKRPVDFKVEPFSGSLRKYKLKCTISGDTKYSVSIDSSITYTKTGFPNESFNIKFSTRKSDYYGSVKLDITGFKGEGEVQLIKSGKTEDILKSIQLDSINRSVIFDFLKPDKYLIKLIEDKNNNKQWDTGDLSLKRQPESVYYYPKALKVKSNWEMKETWEIEQGIPKRKNIADTEPEKLKK
ncbi:MAG: Ig-like domain-containing protein [Prolixibacteraceae bacterium]|nr:Ig-like domain-containing protein [Prolixibacteraceae bacterium]